MSRILPQWENKSLAQLHKILDDLYQAMIDSQIKTDYPNAQKYRICHQNCQNYILERNVKQNNQLRDDQIADKNKMRKRELKDCKQNWHQKIREYNEEQQNLLKQIQNRNYHQAEALRLQLEQQLSLVVKQSHQLINLRKMQQHASKQKNFVEAHSIQQKVQKLYESQKNAWMQGRQKTIQQALKNLRTKQTNQIQGLNRKQKLTIEDYKHGQFKQQQHINQKYDNLIKQLNAKYEREILSLYGQLRNSGGKSPKRRSKAIKSDQKSQISQV